MVEHLRDVGARVRALVRRPDVARLPGGVEVVAGDLTTPVSLDPALDGARARSFRDWARDHAGAFR